jgi:predicted rRNA methylase YqxC with S4 and FtsJ domains
MEVIDFASGEDFGTRGVLRSPLKGPAGNQEFLVWLTYPEGQLIPDSLEEKVNALF